MGVYANWLLPRLMDWSMSGAEMAAYRQAVLADVQGHVLEIGFGTGLNLAYYPEHITQLTTIDANPGMHALAQKRVRQSQITVDHQVLRGEALPMSDQTFDSVVSTWTLCSIAGVDQALAQIYRVLKPGGRFFFMEHGLSNCPRVQTWQHRLTPIQKVVADGCHLNRDIQAIIQQHFDQVDVSQFVLPGLPEFIGYMYKGVAVKQV